MEPETEGLHDTIDWAMIYERLLAVARICTAMMPHVFDGVSAEDLVSESLLAFFTSTDGLGWIATRSRLDTFLAGVLKHKMVDHLRRQSKTLGSLDDPHFAKRVDTSELQLPLADPTELKEMEQRLRSASKGDPKLDELIDAIKCVDGGHNVDQQLAEELSTTTRDIVNRLKRLKRLVRKQPVKAVY